MTDVELLIDYCKKQKIHNFDFKSEGKSIKINIPATFEVENSEDNQLLYCNIKLLHTGKNRNKSSVTYDAAKKCLDTIKYKPLLANFCEIDGVKDFTSHDMEIDENGDIVYIESQVGCFTSDEPQIIKDDKHEDRYYVYAKGAIPKIYTPASEILERKNGSKISAEISVNKMSYDLDKDILILEDIEVSGATFLGTNPNTGKEVQEGMEGARADIETFQNKTIIRNEDINDKVIDMLNSISNKLDDISKFDINTEKGGFEVKHINELLEMYGKNLEDIDFDYESMSNEELDIKFAELFAESQEDISDNDDSENIIIDNNLDDNISDNNVTFEETTNDITVENNDGENNENDTVISDNYSITYNVNKRTFSVSLDEVIYALTILVNETYEIDDTWYECKVYENEIVMTDIMNGNSYKQSYKKKRGCNSYSLVGDRIPVKSIYVTEDEEKALDDMKKNYSEISENLKKYEDEPEKIKVLESEEYEMVSDSKEFMELKDRKNYFDLTLDEVKTKADEILLSYAKSGKLKFSVEKENKDVQTKRIGFNSDLSKSKPKSRYGTLFSK